MIYAFFATVLLFSLALNAYDKLMSYKEDKRTIWLDGDSVLVREDDEVDLYLCFGEKLSDDVYAV